MASPRDEMQIKWMGIGEQLDEYELEYVLDNNIEPGFNDHSSRTVLEAYRAGRANGSGHCCGL